MRTLLLLCFVVAALSATNLETIQTRITSELRARSCPTMMDSESCIANNDFAHPQHNSKHVACLWCHSHDDDSQTSHCASLDTVRSGHKYKSGWVCDYHTPLVSSDHHHHHKHPHSLDVNSPITVEDPYGGSSKMGGGKMGGGSKMGGSKMGGGAKMGGSKMGGSGKMGAGTGSGKPKETTEPTDNSVSGQVKAFLSKAPKPVQFLGGLAMGVLGMIPFQPTKVIAGVDAVENDVQNLFSKFSLSSGSGLANDVVLLANTVKDMTNLLKAAGAIEVAEKAAEVAAKADSPIGWVIGAGELALNGVNVYQDFSGALEAYHQGNYFEVGKKVGDIISILAE